MEIKLDEYEIAVLISSLEENIELSKKQGNSPSYIRGLKNILNKCNKTLKEEYPNYLAKIVNI